MCMEEVRWSISPNSPRVDNSVYFVIMIEELKIPDKNKKIKRFRRIGIDQDRCVNSRIKIIRHIVGKGKIDVLKKFLTFVII